MTHALLRSLGQMLFGGVVTLIVGGAALVALDMWRTR